MPSMEYFFVLVIFLDWEFFCYQGNLFNKFLKTLTGVLKFKISSCNFSFCLFIIDFFSFIFIYSFWRACICNFKEWDTFMQLCHNRNSLRHIWNLVNPQILLQNLLSKNNWWKYSSPFWTSNMLWNWKFHQEVPLAFEDDITFHFCR